MNNMEKVEKWEKETGFVEGSKGWDRFLRVLAFRSGRETQALLAPIAQDFPGRVVAARAHNAAPRMRRCSAQVQPRNGSPVPGVARHRPQKEQLTRGHRSLKDVAPREAETPLQVQRRQ